MNLEKKLLSNLIKKSHVKLNILKNYNYYV